jgi:hypothetical protein
LLTRQFTSPACIGVAIRFGRRGAILALLVGLMAVVGCVDPCQELANRLCGQSKSDQACERWQARTKRVDKSTCEAGLRTLDKEAFR